MKLLLLCLVILLGSASSAHFNWTELNLVESHIPYMFNHQPELKQQCIDDPNCPFKNYAEQGACWGFEHGCKQRFGSSHATLDCLNEDSKLKYWHQADFGYVRKRLDEFQSGELCEPSATKRSSLRCTRDATMCHARNLYVDLRSLGKRTAHRDKVVLEKGEIGGYCDLNQVALDKETNIKRHLSTWGDQLSPYTQLSFDPFEDPQEHCDELIKTPVIFMQLDFTGNMYHHFCDFFNLYLTQLTNSSWFSTDNLVVRWDNSARFGDLFKVSWKVFTNQETASLYNFGGKRICFSEVIFSFLPRMGSGLFYSTYLENYCRETGLFRAFTQHFLHRMNIIDANLVPTSLPQEEQPTRIRVTFLDRNHTDKYQIFRKVYNQDELIEAINKIPNMEAQVYAYSSSMAFEEQLDITHNSDVLVGMHGAGLAHFMFLPDWAVAFELYNCGDFRCYRDLARLRGLRYLTWEDPSKLIEHDRRSNENPKFWNFSFDVNEFVRLMQKARSWLLEHPRFAHLKKHHEEL